jgi:hypothetical protein
MDAALREEIPFSCVVAARRGAGGYRLLTEHGAWYAYRHRSPSEGGLPGRAAEAFGAWAEAAARLQEHPARRPDAVIIWSHSGRPVLALGPTEGAPGGARVAVVPLEPAHAEPAQAESARSEAATPASSQRWPADARRL